MHRAERAAAGYIGRRRFSRPGSGVAKVERQFSRAAAALAEEERDDIFRPHAVSRPRPLPPFAEADPARPLGTEDDDEELPVLRTRRRVPVKRGRLPRGRLGRILIVGGVAGAIALVITILVGIHNFFMTDARFRIDSASSIQVLGNSQVTRPELLSVFGSDIGRNIFHVPLAVRKAELEQVPWVEHATVMRLLPNQLRVSVVERVPVAFVREGNQIGLVDRNGVLLDMPPAIMAAKRYSFPVVTGVTAQQSAEERAARMRLYAEFMKALNSTGTTAGSQISEVDLSDPEDVRVLLPSAGSDLLVHFGSDDFATRWQRLEQKLPQWRQQYPRLAGIDLRYQRQTVLEMSKTADERNSANASSISAQASAKPAMKTAARPIARSRPAIQRAKAAVTHKAPQKLKAIHKPVHRAATHGDQR
jgi:cell division protein FtsQ